MDPELSNPDRLISLEKLSFWKNIEFLFFFENTPVSDCIWGRAINSTCVCVCVCVCVLVAQSCLTLCDPVDYSPPGSSVHGILQARIMAWVAIPFSRDLPDPGIKPRSPALWVDSLASEPPEKPFKSPYRVGSFFPYCYFCC